MSHLDAPLRSRRHSDPPPIDLRRRKSTPATTNDTTIHTARNALPDHLYDDPSAPPSSFARASLKTLLLPAQLELRRVSARAKPVPLAAAHHPVPLGPKHFSTDSTFELHALVARQSAGGTGRTALLDALDALTASTDCDALAPAYAGSRAQLEALECGGERELEPGRGELQQGSGDELQPGGGGEFEEGGGDELEQSCGGAREQVRRSSGVEQGRSGRGDEHDGAAADHDAGSQHAAPSPYTGSRAVLQSSVESLFSQALSDVSSRRAAATTSSATPTSAPSSSTVPSSSSTLPSSTSSGADPSATVQPAKSNNNRIAKIVGPSVAIPLGLLLLALLAFCCLRRRRQRRGAAGLASGRSTPAIGPISNPQPMQAAPRQYGAMARYGPGVGAVAGAGVGAAAGAAAVGASRGNSSQESVGTTPSAIGVAFSEPRTKWGRRSLVDVLAGGVRSANSGSNTPTGSAGGSQDLHAPRGVSASSSFGGRQASITSLASGSVPSEYRGVGGYNSFGYQPGQMRPVMTPIGGHYDPFGPSSSIVAVPASARRHHPISSEEGSISGYGSGDEDVPRPYTAGAAPSGLSHSGSGSASGESITARLAPPLAAGYAHSPQALQSRTTQATTSAGEDGYYTADAGPSSFDDHEAETLSEEGLREFGVGGSPEAASVNFGSGSSGSGSGSGSAGQLSLSGSGPSFQRASEDPNATPRLNSAPSTPRLGSGHGSLGNRRNDGTGSWWN
ncbi:hypothetical protein JCM10449v2_000538 [Rhodotorula kratochvilovae]